MLEQIIWYFNILMLQHSFSLIGTSAIRYGYYIYGQPSFQPPYLTSFSCSGLENQLLSCRFRSTDNNYRSRAVGVRCYGERMFCDFVAWPYEYIPECTLLFTCCLISVIQTSWGHTFLYLYSQFWLYWGGCTSCWRKDRDGGQGGGVSQPDMVGCYWLLLVLGLQSCHCCVQASTLPSKL